MSGNRRLIFLFVLGMIGLNVWLYRPLIKGEALTDSPTQPRIARERATPVQPAVTSPSSTDDDPGGQGSAVTSPPAPDAPRVPRLGPQETVIGILMLQSDEKLRPSAQQKRLLRTILKQAVEPIQVFYFEVATLQEVLTFQQIQYLNENRGPLVLEAGRPAHPDLVVDAALKVVRKRAAEKPTTTPLVQLTGVPRQTAVSGQLGLDELLAAPIRLENKPDLVLTSKQAKQFEQVLKKHAQVVTLEKELTQGLYDILTPAQATHIANMQGRLDVMRRLAPMSLAIERLSAP